MLGPHASSLWQNILKFLPKTKFLMMLNGKKEKPQDLDLSIDELNATMVMAIKEVEEIMNLFGTITTE